MISRWRGSLIAIVLMTFFVPLASAEPPMPPGSEDTLWSMLQEAATRNNIDVSDPIWLAATSSAILVLGGKKLFSAAREAWRADHYRGQARLAETQAMINAAFQQALKRASPELVQAFEDNRVRLEEAQKTAKWCGSHYALLRNGGIGSAMIGAGLLGLHTAARYSQQRYGTADLARARNHKTAEGLREYELFQAKILAGFGETIGPGISPVFAKYRFGILRNLEEAEVFTALSSEEQERVKKAVESTLMDDQLLGDKIRRILTDESASLVRGLTPASEQPVSYLMTVIEKGRFNAQDPSFRSLVSHVEDALLRGLFSSSLPKGASADFLKQKTHEVIQDQIQAVLLEQKQISH